MAPVRMVTHSLKKLVSRYTLAMGQLYHIGRHLFDYHRHLAAP
jgi:hypothetical protein